jgi:CDP-diacylglycerol--glycerol-3-phosphate 3-phosphatidyltransferase/cardiolipin synthase
MRTYAARDALRVPGLLSLARVPLALLFPVVAVRPATAIAVLVLAALTDIADGWYARRFHVETPLGRILDPITDKVFVIGVVATLIASRLLSAGEALLMGAREVGELVLLLYGALAWRGRPRPAHGANRLGKLATVMQFATVAALLVGRPERRIWIVATAACGILSGLSYAVREYRSRHADGQAVAPRATQAAK